MGYDTDFEGSVSIDPPLNASEISFLTSFSESRRMHRSKGPLFVEGDGYRGQNGDADVIDNNRAHPDQPGLWCQWVPSESGADLEWDEGEKFYNAAEWMKYIVENLLGASARSYIDQHVGEDDRLRHFTCDHLVSGVIEAQGEDPEDQWRLVVEHNVVKVAKAETVFGKPIPI